MRKVRPHRIRRSGGDLRCRSSSFAAAAIPPLAQQANEPIRQAPLYLQQAQDNSSTIGRLNDRFHLHQRLADMINGDELEDYLLVPRIIGRAVKVPAPVAAALQLIMREVRYPGLDKA